MAAQVGVPIWVAPGQVTGLKVEIPILAGVDQQLLRLVLAEVRLMESLALVAGAVVALVAIMDSRAARVRLAVLAAL